MKRCIWLLLIAVLGLGCGAAFAGDLEDAVAAIDNKEYAKARKLVVPLAQQGNRDAYRILGFMYMYEAGVPQDTAKAYTWWSVAAAQGDSKSGDYRDSVAKLLSKEQLAQAKKAANDCKTRKFKGCF